MFLFSHCIHISKKKQKEVLKQDFASQFQVREEQHSIHNGETTELTLNSMGFPSGVWSPIPLVAVPTISAISFHLRCVLGCSVWIWMKRNLFWFIWASLGMPKWVWPSMPTRCRLFCAQTSTPHLSMHRILTEHGRWCMQNNQLPPKSHVKLKDNSNLSVRIILPKVGTRGFQRSGGIDSGFCVRSCSNREFKTRSCFPMLPVSALLNNCHQQSTYPRHDP
jgi:hypothetical protein